MAAIETAQAEACEPQTPHKKRYQRLLQERGYLTTSQAAKLLGIGRTTIRRYEGGLFPVFERDEAGGRVFTRAVLGQMNRALKRRR